jgi:hypothetical protein
MFYYKDSSDGNYTKFDVLVLSSASVLSRVNGETGAEAWFWVSDRGNIKFHTMTVQSDIVYLVGADESQDNSEFAIVGIDIQTGVVCMV